MENFSDPTLVMFGKLALAALLGMLIGTERSVIARQPAGSRTFALVSLASCLFILAGIQVNTQYIGLVNFDPTRVLAAIVQGIGFLGAGLIIFKNETLHGVTTAAGLWLAAGVGAVVAFGMFNVAVFVTFLTIVIFLGVWFLENNVKHWFQSVSGQDRE